MKIAFEACPRHDVPESSFHPAVRAYSLVELLAVITILLVITTCLLQGRLAGGSMLAAVLAAIPLAYVVLFSYRRADWVEQTRNRTSGSPLGLVVGE